MMMVSGDRASQSPRTAESLVNDPKYQAQIKAREEMMAARRAEWALAQAPLLRDLRDVGWELESIWDLVNTSAPYPEALPILIDHLRRGGYPPRIMEGIARSLGVRPAIVYWDVLVELFATSTDERFLKEGLGVAIAIVATKDKIDEVMELLEDPMNGKNRIFFVKPVLRLGGDRGRALVDSLQDDPAVGKEAKALLARRKPKES